jgi:16S rRNA (guanine966-N2)-methyltransferase
MSINSTGDYPQSVRIIAGHFRGRKIPVPPLSGVRPTPARIRETLFNWLQNTIRGARCLDLFAGSGILGLEALSRGALSTTAVDQHPEVIHHLETLKETLKLQAYHIIQATIPMKAPLKETYDIIFMDPPFHQNRVLETCYWLRDNNYVAHQGLIYIETERELTPLPLPDNWHILKEKTAGAVAYYLIQAS